MHISSLYSHHTVNIISTAVFQSLHYSRMGLSCSRRLRRESSSGGKHQETSIPISEVDKILVCTIEQSESARKKFLKLNGDKMGDLEAESLRAEEVAAGESSSGTEQDNEAMKEELEYTDKTREKEALQHEIQEIETELEKEEALRNATKQAVEVKSCETEALREKLECLKTKHQDLKRENDKVKESIKELELQREFKDSYLELEAFENELRAEYKVLIKTHAEVRERVLKEEQWKDKHDQLKTRTDAMELHHDGLRKEIQSFRDRPETLSDLKADMKTIKKEQKALLNLGESMVRDLRSLQDVHSEMQSVKKQIQSNRSQNIYLRKWIIALSDRIRIRTETRLSDELNAVHAENKDLSDQRDACLQMLK